MGGIGSGPYWGLATKECTDDHRQIDIRRWKREGLLVPGQTFEYNWLSWAIRITWDRESGGNSHAGVPLGWPLAAPTLSEWARTHRQTDGQTDAIGRTVPTRPAILHHESAAKIRGLRLVKCSRGGGWYDQGGLCTPRLAG